VGYRPLLTQNARPATYTVEARDENGALVPTPIAGEHPLTLYVDKQEVVTLMTLGAAPEALAIGFLRNQRLVDSIEEIVAVQVDWDVNAVAVTTRSGLVDLPGHAPGHTGFAFRTHDGQFFYIADACWDRDAMLTGRRLPAVSRWLQDSAEAYADTQDRLRRFAYQ